MNSPPNLANSREYFLVVPKPDRTIHAECRCRVGIASVDGGDRTVLVDAVGSERLPDGRLRIILAEHDCDRARAEEERRRRQGQSRDAGETNAAALAGEILGAVRGGTGAAP